MANFKDKAYSGQTVRLDGNTYEDCNFQNAKLVYSGSGPVSLIRCECSRASIQFEGPAEQTALFMQAMWGDPGLKSFIRHLFPEIPH